MASIQSSSTSAPSSIVNQPGGLPSLVTINAAAQLPIKLAPHNFPSWKAQFTSLLLGHKLLGYIDGSQPCPASEIPSKDDEHVLVPNPAYDHWIQQDQLLLHGMIASATETVIPFFASCTSARSAWSKIQNMYANKSRSRMMHLREKLLQPRGTKSVQEYFQFIRHTADELALINSPVVEDELVIHILNGIGTEFRELSAGIRARESPISFEELLDKMTDYEGFLAKQNSADVHVHTANVARRFLTADKSRQVSKSTSHYKNPHNSDVFVQKKTTSPDQCVSIVTRLVTQQKIAIKSNQNNTKHLPMLRLHRQNLLPIGC